MPKTMRNIYKRKDGRWEGRYKAENGENGKAKYKSVYAKSYLQCKEKLESVLKTMGNAKKIENNNLTLTEIFDEWIENTAIKVKITTLNTYITIANNHILPILGNIEIKDITPDMLNSFVSEKMNNGK